MQNDYHPYHTLYRWKTFWWIFLSFILLAFVMSGMVYYGRRNAIMSEVRDELKTIAANVAAQLPIDLHNKLVASSQENSEEYSKIVDDLRQAIAANPNIDDIYTLRPTGEIHQYKFVVDAMESVDSDNSGIIDEDEEKAHLGEVYSAEDFPDLERGLIEPSADREITYDKWGAWISGYAPLYDEHGIPVAILGVDYSASVLMSRRLAIFRSIWMADLIMLPIFFLIALWISYRLVRPFRMLAVGMYLVTHDNPRYRLPLEGHGEEVGLVHLFNNMLNALSPNVQPDRTKAVGPEKK